MKLWWEERRRLRPVAVVLQSMVRGHLVRIHHNDVYQRIRLLYKKRQIESRNGMVVMIQRQVRRYMVHRRLEAFKEFIQRGRLNRVHAAITMQQAMRVFLARKVFKELMSKHLEWKYVRTAAARRLQKYFQDLAIRVKAAKAKENRRIRKLLEQKSATYVQSIFRGFLSREQLNKQRILEATRWFAATLIQKVFRGTQVLYWRDIRLNAIAAFILDRHAQERFASMVSCSSRYHRFIIDHRHDSASDDDDDHLVDTSDWVEAYNQQNGRKYWFNAVTKEKTFIEPSSSHAVDMAYVGLRVRIHWVAQGSWYEGWISRFNARKRKYRIDYDDGDHEWMNIDREADRIQVWNNDAWVIKQLYIPAEKKAEAEKSLLRMQEKEEKNTAWRDVKQWSVIRGDTLKSNKVMFMSNLNGEIRTGAGNCLDWALFEDDMGYPIFVNSVNGAKSYEDPRFLYDVSENVKEQREFLLQEIRYVLYFCDALLDGYYEALKIEDQRAISKALRALRESEKPKQLSALALRAKSLFKQTSVLDKPLDLSVQTTLDEASSKSENLASILSTATDTGIMEIHSRRVLLDSLSEKSRQSLICWNCKHETRRHHEFCPTCGKKQLF